jgi:putative acetyltransferase
MPTFCIRPIRSEDNSLIATVIRKVLIEFKANKPGTVFFDPTTDALFQLFSKPNAAYFIAEADGEIVGGSGIYPTPGLPPDYCELVKLYLLPKMRGFGLGFKLMEQCFNKAKELGFTNVYLETMPELCNAIGLYEKAGFSYLSSPLGQSGHFGCDLWMAKNLH